MLHHWVAGREVGGHTSCGGQCAAERSLARCLSQRSSWSLREEGHITDLAFDTAGDLVAVARTTGKVDILDVLTLQTTTECHRTTPVCTIEATGCIEAVRWNPGNQDILACAISSSLDVLVYDLRRFRVHPTMIFHGSPSGHFDVQYLTTHIIAAGGRDGVIRVWDARCGSRPRITLSERIGSSDHLGRGGAVYALQAPEDGSILVSGSQTGLVRVWDVRLLSSCLSTFALGDAIPRHQAENPQHPRVEVWGAFDAALEAALAKDRRRSSQNSVDALAYFPGAVGSIGFVLGGGECGLLHLANNAITHLFTPCHENQHGESCAWRRKGGFLPATSLFLVGSVSSQIPILDFASPRAYALMGRRRVTRRHAVVPELFFTSTKLTSPSTCVAGHPLVPDFIVVGLENGTVGILGIRNTHE